MCCMQLVLLWHCMQLIPQQHLCLQVIASR
jgi:hypothetical protein